MEPPSFRHTIGCVSVETDASSFSGWLAAIMNQGATILDGHHATRGEAAAIADAVNLVEDGRIHGAGSQEVAVQGVRPAVRLHRA